MKKHEAKKKQSRGSLRVFANRKIFNVRSVFGFYAYALKIRVDRFRADSNFYIVLFLLRHLPCI